MQYFLVSYETRRSILLLLFTSGYFIRQKSRKLQIQLFGGHFGIMTVQYFFNIVRIQVLLPDNIKYQARLPYVCYLPLSGMMITSSGALPACVASTRNCVGVL